MFKNSLVEDMNPREGTETRAGSTVSLYAMRIEDMNPREGTETTTSIFQQTEPIEDMNPREGTDTDILL